MKKVYFINSNIKYGGATKVMVEIANYFASKNIEVGIITYDTNHEKENFYHLDNSIIIKNIAIKRNIPKLRRVSQVLNLMKIIRADKPDVLIAFQNTTNMT
jgi:GalNAc-alpha-(1->4)-GalNAc-alpha-(1->3)-diNAcBac-PP-undecaprenol alpha-1,4-N-acetyl-D-galactosaminyltransferase